MMNETIKEYWEELNNMWGTDIELPEGLEQDIEQSLSDVLYDVAMGNSFDNAMQRGM
jgi:transcription elongation factor GreA-like protein